MCAMDVSGTTDLNLGILQLGDTLDLSAERAQRLGQSGEGLFRFAFPAFHTARQHSRRRTTPNSVIACGRGHLLHVACRWGRAQHDSDNKYRTCHSIFFRPTKKTHENARRSVAFELQVAKYIYILSTCPSPCTSRTSPGPTLTASGACVQQACSARPDRRSARLAP